MASRRELCLEEMTNLNSLMLFTRILLIFSLLFTKSLTIDVIFTVKNLSTNEQLKTKFLTMITSLFQHTSIAKLRLHVIAESASQQYVDKILANLKYNHEVNKINIDEITSKYSEFLTPLIKHFSSSHTYYKDPLFFLSPFLHRILPEHINQIIMLDIDIRFDNDIEKLYNLFNSFSQNHIIGVARENQPVYRHLLWSYRQENPQTNIGDPPPYGITGFNSGVLLLDLKKIRQSTLFNTYLNNTSNIEQLKQKYHFRNPHLGDQDFYTLLSFEHSELFYILPCHWNRQLCTWWKGKGYDDIWDNYFNCNNEQDISLYHGNCNTEIPKRLVHQRMEL